VILDGRKIELWAAVALEHSRKARRAFRDDRDRGVVTLALAVRFCFGRWRRFRNFRRWRWLLFPTAAAGKQTDQRHCATRYRESSHDDVCTTRLRAKQAGRKLTPRSVLANVASVIDLLAPGGELSRAIPHYEDRAEQREMSAAVARALDDGRTLLVEAGTGTGKTLAYLVPALASGKRVIVSTATRTLQDQIARNDVPLLRTIVARPFTAVVLKGVSNYVCRRKLATAALSDDIGAAIASWAEHSATGDRAEVEWLAEDSSTWSEITTTPDARIGPRCPYFDRCFVTQARRLAERADLILVNHHLYLSDCALRATAPGARVLPDHDAVIFDEAHQLEEVATEHFGKRVSTHAMAKLVHDAKLALTGLALWEGFHGSESIHGVESAAASLFAATRNELLDGTESRIPLPEGFLGRSDLRIKWFALDDALEQLARVLETEAETRPAPDPTADDSSASSAPLTAVARRARNLRDDLADIADQTSRAYAYWGEVRPTGTTLVASPIEVGEVLRRHLLQPDRPTIFTSATLAIAGDFAYTRRRLGVESADELLVPSSFDYARQALLYVPRDLPQPADDEFSAAAAQRTLELLELTRGHAFLLFTSHRALRDAAARLASSPYPRLVQGDAPRATLVERFRATPGAILLGTGSFWEGVDVPGDALALVVIDKLPFASHLDPLRAARARACAEANIDPFSALQLPAAALALKQGFGRLIRRRDDRGIVAVLDHRLVTKTYGRVFFETLPAGLPRTSSLEQVRRWWVPTS
jgi:ATP-dependent DNA helicase DinG